MTDPAIYILYGTLPAEAIIHKRVLSLFGNITRLSGESIELRLAKYQLAIKTFKSHSWFISVKELLIKYDLPDPQTLIQTPLQNSVGKISTIRELTDTGEKEYCPSLSGIPRWSTYQNCTAWKNVNRPSGHIILVSETLTGFLWRIRYWLEVIFSKRIEWNSIKTKLAQCVSFAVPLTKLYSISSWTALSLKGLGNPSS